MLQSQLIDITHLETNKGQIEGLPSNPRFIKDEAFKSLVRSLQEDPDMLELREVIAYPLDKNRYMVIGGNQRLMAGLELRFTEMPVKVLPKATPLEKLKRIVIKDNGSWGNHDWDLLANEWSDLPLDDWGIDLPSNWLQEPEETDYSDKNKEVNLDDFEEKMEFKLKLTSDEFFDLQERLSVVKSKQNVDTNEQAIFELLGYYERHA